MKSEYSRAFQSDAAAQKYENIVYDENGYDAFIWNIQRGRVLKVIENFKKSNNREFEHLDFACGTGRILAEVETVIERTTGLDISPNMISVAQKKVKHAQLVVGDILHHSTLEGKQYDLITAFRFFLNAEPDLRKKIMESLGLHLRDSQSRLIFNIQGNKNSLRHFSIAKRIKKGERQSEMSVAEIRELVDRAGLKIIEWYGIGVCPPVLHRSFLAPVMRFVDRLCEPLPIMKRISYDLLFVCGPKS